MSHLHRVANCQDSERIGDVVFIHGLDGDAIETWHPHGNREAFWPGWLADDSPNVGVWSVDYAAAALGWKTDGMPLLLRATECLELFEVEGLGERPLVFVTHSLGGLVAKQMIRHAHDTGKHWLPKATAGIVFMATPHTGSKAANWVDRLSNYLPLRANEIVKNLRDNDAALGNLNDWYRNHVKDFGIQTKVYFEEAKTKAVVTVVDRVAANPHIAGVDPIPIDADHISICKPTSREQLIYKSVKKFVCACLDTAQSAANQEQHAGSSRTTNVEFDVFLCHNSQDKDDVLRIAKELRSHGLKPWLDQWELRPGLPWQRALEQQIEHISAAAVFVGGSGFGPWQQLEQEAFLREFVKRKCPVIPVILAKCPEQPELPLFLSGMTWVDFRKSEPDPLDSLVWGITGSRTL